MSPFTSGVLVALTCGFVVTPLLTLWHELGHACVPLLFSDGPVHVQLGQGPRGVSVAVGRLNVRVSPPRLGVGFCHWGGLPNRLELLACALGPISSLVALGAALALQHVLTGFPKYLMQGTAVLAAVQFLATATPMRYPSWWGPYAGLTSDGLRIWRLCRPSHTTRRPPT